MKFCPHCGKKPRVSRTQIRKPPVKRPTPKPGPTPVPNPMDENYDGYYDDVPTADNGRTGEKFDPALIKRIALVAAGTVLIVILSVVMMYVL